MRSTKKSRSLSSVMVHVILPFRVQALIAYILTGVYQQGEANAAFCAKRETSAAKATRAQTTTTATAVKTSLKKKNLTPPPPPKPPLRFSRVGDVIKNHGVLNISRFVLKTLYYTIYIYRLYPQLLKETGYRSRQNFKVKNNGASVFQELPDAVHNPLFVVVVQWTSLKKCTSKA